MEAMPGEDARRLLPSSPHGHGCQVSRTPWGWAAREDGARGRFQRDGVCLTELDGGPRRNPQPRALAPLSAPGKVYEWLRAE